MSEFNCRHDDSEMLKAAYALNMCTVSISQIVDYNDIYVLEQEYNAILNNLNLEQMPKDEALLDILVKLLDTITFFRIDEIKKKQIEKHYEQRIKNAIWKAIPNISVIVTGNPVAIAYSLATQVGIGYMNYRMEKASATLEKEDMNVELEMTAIEQFNALRRELFTTAWRLADEYNFPDQYRLTERQIGQYNRILMDSDVLRKYDRLASVQDKFCAYPPFWYYMGHYAKYISEDNGLQVSQGTRNFYRKEAVKYFDKYDSLNKFNILREDELTASFALEYVDLLLSEKEYENEKVNRLISTAVKMAGNANDILQLCAVTYLKIGNTPEAEKLLRILVNENYNASTNAKLLSRLYVTDYLNLESAEASAQYEMLKLRVPDTWLFPMPVGITADSKKQDDDLQAQFLNNQKDVLKRKYHNALEEFIEKYIVLFNRVLPVPVKNASDSYFLNTEDAIQKRNSDVQKELESLRGDDFRTEIRESGFRFRYIELLNRMLNSLDTLRLFSNSESKDAFILLLSKNIAVSRRELKYYHDRLERDGTFKIEDYKNLQHKYSFENLTMEFFNVLETYIDDQIDEIKKLDSADELEMDITRFCHEQGIKDNEISANKLITVSEEAEDTEYISPEILGANEKDEKVSKKVQDQMIQVTRNATENLIKKPDAVKLLVKGDAEFETYFKNVKFRNYSFKSKTLAIIDDHSLLDSDLFIAQDGIVPVKFGIVGKIRKFDKASYTGHSISFGWPDEYSNSAVDMGALYNLIVDLEGIRKRK